MDPDGRIGWGDEFLEGMHGWRGGVDGLGGCANWEST